MRGAALSGCFPISVRGSLTAGADVPTGRLHLSFPRGEIWGSQPPRLGLMRLGPCFPWHSPLSLWLFCVFGMLRLRFGLRAVSSPPFRGARFGVLSPPSRDWCVLARVLDVRCFCLRAAVSCRCWRLVTKS